MYNCHFSLRIVLTASVTPLSRRVYLPGVCLEVVWISLSEVKEMLLWYT